MLFWLFPVLLSLAAAGFFCIRTDGFPQLEQAIAYGQRNEGVCFLGATKFFLKKRRRRKNRELSLKKMMAKMCLCYPLEDISGVLGPTKDK